MTKLAEQRLAKVEAKRVRIIKAERGRFLEQVIEASAQAGVAQQEAARLVDRVRAAKSAPFLQQFRAAR